MKSTEWKLYRSRRLWAMVIANQLGIFALFFWLFSKNAFFLMGPIILYNVIIYLFPYWYQLFFDGPCNRGPKFQQFLKKAREIFPPAVHLDIRSLENLDLNNFLILSHNRRLWIFTSPQFLEALSTEDTDLLLVEIETLRAMGRLQTATLLSALQFTLPIGIWHHNRGAELVFFSQNKDIRWQRLNFKIFHWSENKNTSTRAALIPCLLFPALTSYNPTSYFNVYNYFRENVINSLKTEETHYGK